MPELRTIGHLDLPPVGQRKRREKNIARIVLDNPGDAQGIGNRQSLGVNLRPPMKKSFSPSVRAIASSRVRQTSTPAAAGKVRLRTRLRRSGSGRPIEAKVRRPITTAWPRVSSRKRRSSSGICQGMPFSRPMTWPSVMATRIIISDAVFPTGIASHAVPLSWPATTKPLAAILFRSYIAASLRAPPFRPL